MKQPAAQTHLAPLDQSQRYTIDEAMTYLRLGRRRLYEKIAAREIETIQDGHRRYVPGTEIARLSSTTSSAK